MPVPIINRSKRKKKKPVRPHKSTTAMLRDELAEKKIKALGD